MNDPFQIAPYSNPQTTSGYPRTQGWKWLDKYGTWWRWRWDEPIGAIITGTEKRTGAKASLRKVGVKYNQWELVLGRTPNDRIDPYDLAAMQDAIRKNPALMPPPEVIYTQGVTAEQLTPGEATAHVKALHREQHLRNEWLRRALAADDKAEIDRCIASLREILEVMRKFGIEPAAWTENQSALLEAGVIGAPMEREKGQARCPAPHGRLRKWRNKGGRMKKLLYSVPKSNSRGERPRPSHIDAAKPSLSKIEQWKRRSAPRVTLPMIASMQNSKQPPAKSIS